MPDLTDRFLEGNGSGYIEAGLPNITGEFGSYATNAIAESNELMQGAFNTSNKSYGRAFSAINGTTYPITFNASRSNSIYGNSTTVQPSTCKAYFIIKY